MIRRVPATLVSQPLLALQLEPCAAAPEIEPAPAAPSASLAAQLSAALVALLGDELRLRPEHILSVVERELSRVGRAHHVELRLHPLDLELMPPSATLSERAELRGALTLTPDATLERGGCVLITNLGEVDARLETRLSLALALLRSGWPA
jgi:flagellar biosynthesis/type III secretory pathway protein FliH